MSSPTILPDDSGSAGAESPSIAPITFEQIESGTPLVDAVEQICQILVEDPAVELIVAPEDNPGDANLLFNWAAKIVNKVKDTKTGSKPLLAFVTNVFPGALEAEHLKKVRGRTNFFRFPQTLDEWRSFGRIAAEKNVADRVKFLADIDFSHVHLSDEYDGLDALMAFVEGVISATPEGSTAEVMAVFVSGRLEIVLNEGTYKAMRRGIVTKYLRLTNGRGIPSHFDFLENWGEMDLVEIYELPGHGKVILRIVGNSKIAGFPKTGQYSDAVGALFKPKNEQ